METGLNMNSFYKGYKGYDENTKVSTPLALQLWQEIEENEDKVFPQVLIFVDESALFWVTNTGEYVWLQEHSDINNYVDETHQIEERRYTDKSTEGVSLRGVYWMNNEFECPFHVLEFQHRIEQINV